MVQFLNLIGFGLGFKILGRHLIEKDAGVDAGHSNCDFAWEGLRSSSFKRIALARESSSSPLLSYRLHYCLTISSNTWFAPSNTRRVSGDNHSIACSHPSNTGCLSSHRGSSQSPVMRGSLLHLELLNGAGWLGIRPSKPELVRSAHNPARNRSYWVEGRLWAWLAIWARWTVIGLPR